MRNSRNSDLIDQKLYNSVTVVGAGSIGSTVIQDLAMMGYKKIIAIDHDILAEHNLSTTRYPSMFVGSKKVDCANLTAKDLNNEIEFIPVPYKVQGAVQKFVTESVIVCTDNMKSRKWIYDKWKSSESIYLIDVRMAAMSIEVVVTTKENDNYLEYWTEDENIPDEPCTAKYTVFTTSIASGLAVNGLYSVIAKKPYWQYTHIALNPIILSTKNLIIPKEKENES